MLAEIEGDSISCEEALQSRLLRELDLCLMSSLLSGFGQDNSTSIMRRRDRADKRRA